MNVVLSQPTVTTPHKIIWLIGGGFAIVDPEDYEDLMSVKWRKHRSGPTYYAYSRRQVKGKMYYVYLHRLVMKAPDWMKVHHINHAKNDDRKCNLQLVTEREHRHFDGWHIFRHRKKT